MAMVKSKSCVLAAEVAAGAVEQECMANMVVDSLRNTLALSSGLPPAAEPPARYLATVNAQVGFSLQLAMQLAQHSQQQLRSSTALQVSVPCGF